jgi:hypothetical protein
VDWPPSSPLLPSSTNGIDEEESSAPLIRLTLLGVIERNAMTLRRIYVGCMRDITSIMYMASLCMRLERFERSSSSHEPSHDIGDAYVALFQSCCHLNYAALMAPAIDGGTAGMTNAQIDSMLSMGECILL